MQLTKFRHSCVRVDDGDRALVLDPGLFSDVAPALDGVDAVLITHEHADHVDPDALRAAAKANSSLRVYAPAAVRETFADLGDQVTAVGPGETFQAAGFDVRTFGGQHAVIHPLVPVIANVGYLIDGAVYHPGDSFAVPQAPVSVLLLPAVAPWSKISETIDFAIAVRAPKAYPIHDAIVNDYFHGILQNMLKPLAERYAVDFGSFADPVSA
ncbi:MBL fold metallo-hydrolase [uncultured Jatrophihabitans sp.]|uniref:MBL fold metallo-hydrolase n=1 Tax=uncultured Jatrophihabitans sp. TaxID=1610747 RepID=UPI0035CA10F4